MIRVVSFILVGCVTVMALAACGQRAPLQAPPGQVVDTQSH